VNRETGHVWVKRLVCAHDCGLVINLDAMKALGEGAVGTVEARNAPLMLKTTLG